MAKKNSNIFTIGFDTTNELHIQAITILNSLPARKKANYIAQAVVKYQKGVKQTSINNTTEKRKRGRPPKIQQTVQEVENTVSSTAVTNSEPVGSAKTSSQYIESNHTVSGTNNASDAMVDSMMAFLQDN